MLQIIRDLGKLNRVFCSKDYDRAISYLLKILPFEVVRFKSNQEYNGWIIPPAWDVKEARIVKDGKQIFDGLEHPLRVIALSEEFSGRVDLVELKRHLHYDQRFSNAVPFHFRQQYRSWERDWGFCVTKDFYDSLAPGTYDVVIRTEEAAGELKILEYTHEGALNETFAFVAHLDHPGMANDDLAGCAVGIELFRYLCGIETKFTYKLILVQEIIGSEFYLGIGKGAGGGKILESVFLEMLGSKTGLCLQESLSGATNLEWAITSSLDEMGVECRRAPFQSGVSNDEGIWEAYGIPMVSISRYPYPEYHTDLDDYSVIWSDALSEAVEVMKQTINRLERVPFLFKNFRGTLCLSNPKYDLYVDIGQEAFGVIMDETQKRYRRLMEIIPTLSKPVSVGCLSRRVGLEERDTLSYLRKWSEKKLVTLL